MSGQGNMINFEVIDPLDDSQGAVIVAGIPLASGTPTDSQVISYDDTTKQLQNTTLPTSAFFGAALNDSFTPTVDSDITLPIDLLISGTDVTRVSATVFRLQPGIYRLVATARQFTFADTGPSQQISIEFYNHTNASLFGPIADAGGFTASTRVSIGSIETIQSFTTVTDISLRTPAVSGISPSITAPYIYIYKLDR